MPINQDKHTSPSGAFASVTPSDTVNITGEPRALFIGTGGDVVVVGQDDVAVTFANVQQGQTLPVRAKRVNATSTTASNIVALY